MLANVIFCAGLSLILYALYRYIRLMDDYFDKRNIPHEKPFFIFGNTFGFLLRKYSTHDFIQNLYNKYSTSKLVGLFDFRQPFFMVRDPEMLRKMAVKDFDHFEDHRTFIDENSDEMFGNSLFLLTGEKWRAMRATLSPAFTGSKMRQMFDLVTDCAIDMAKHFRDRAEAGEKLGFEMKELFSRYTNDVIASAAFGIKVDSFRDKENDFFVTGMKFSNFNSLRGALKLMLIRLAPFIARTFNIQLMDSDFRNFFQTMVLDNMKVREEKGIFRPDMINILMNVKKGISGTIENVSEDKGSKDGFATVEESNIGKMESKRVWTDIELVAQCFLFFVAGFDTTSTLLSFLFHELIINPDVQDKLYEEIVQTEEMLNGKPLDYDTLQKMKYMDLVITEALRKWPPAPVVDRLCVKDYTYDDGELKFVIDKGLAFWIPIYSFHHDPKYFPNPERFDPDRFNDDNKDSIIPYTYIPFGVGPRNCIGSRFALMELKAITYYLLLNFKFQPNEKTQIPLRVEKNPFAAKSEKGIHMDFVLRVK